MDYTPYLTLLQEKGRDLFSPQFRIYPTDHHLLQKLIAYFLKNEEQAAHFQINLLKGILLTGPIGTGKTTLMTLLSFLSPKSALSHPPSLSPHRSFALKSCRDVTFEFLKEGHQVIQKYSNQSFASTYPVDYDLKKPIIYCFDDLGTESGALKHFGNTCNVIGEILLSRYDHFLARKMLTHATTNLSASELEACYGNRVRSRMREMFNLLSFDKGAEDKRK